MSIGDLAAIFEALGLVYLGWRQNRIFERQNDIFAAQAGQTATPNKPDPRSFQLAQYWPTLVMVATGALIAFSIYDRHHPGLNLLWPIAICVAGMIAAAGILLIQHRRSSLEQNELARVNPSNDEQVRQSNAHPEKAIFSPLQIDIFRLAKELRQFVNVAGPYPDKAAYGYKGDKVPDDAESIHAYFGAKQAVDRQLVFGYQRLFAARLRDVLLRAGEVGYPLFNPDWGTHVRDRDGFMKMAADLEMSAMWFSRNPHNTEAVKQGISNDRTV